VPSGKTSALNVTLSKRPQDGQAAMTRGTALYKDRQYAPAAEAFGQAVRSNPRSVRAHLWLGMTYTKLSQDARAAESFKKAIDLAPQSREASTAKEWLRKLQARAPAPPKPLDVGASAPAFSLKDRVGVLHRLQDAGGRRTVVLLVWKLDEAAKQLIRDFDRRLETSSDSLAGLVVVLQPDRVAIRGFITAGEIDVPVLLGSWRVARAYGVPSGVLAMYLVSEQGAVAQRQVGTIRLASVIP
jgi:tetratricopeptide (TPR) repeat protein